VRAAAAIPEDARTGTRWGRASSVLLAALLAVATLGAELARGALATALVVAQNTNGTLATSSLYGTDFGLVISPQTYQSPTGTTTSTRNVMRLAFANGRIDDLCIAEPQSIGALNYTVMITAGDGDPGTWEITADHIILDLTQAVGTLNLDGYVGGTTTNPEAQIGTDSARVAVAGIDPAVLNGGLGWWGIKAGIAKFGPVTATVQQMTIQGALTMPNLHITIAAAGTTCPAPAAPTGAPS
jgi:hypothetical protein